MRQKKFIGEPQSYLFTSGETLHKDIKYANPEGDTINLSEVNNVKRVTNTSVKTEVNRTGVYFRMMAAPSFLYKDF
jgi:hypothetical protein